MNALCFAPPDTSTEEIAEAVEREFALTGEYARVHGESDVNHCLRAASGIRYLVRVGRVESDRAGRIAMQMAALRHIFDIDPSCPVPRCVPTQDGDMKGRVEIGGVEHPLTVMSWLPGTPIADPPDATQSYRIGKALAQVAAALRSFIDPAGGSFVAWDVGRRLVLDAELQSTLSDEVKALCSPVFDWADQTLPRLLARCRHQMHHGDGHAGNILMQDGQVSGIIDFADIGFIPTVQNLAIALASLQRLGGNRSAERALIAGYQSLDPLDRSELALLTDFVRFRHVTSLAFCDALIEGPGETPAYAQHSRARLLDLLPDQIRPPRQTRKPIKGPVLHRRLRVTDPFSHYFYEDPPTIVSGHGVTLVSEEGRAYLDIYNNTACVGHCHPHVAEAIADQVRRHNLNSRFIDETIVTYAERLTSCFPDGLDKVLFTCTGSEANDLAIRLARQLTGAQGVILVENAYHGNTDLLRRLNMGSTDESVRVPVPLEENDLNELEHACRSLVQKGAGVAVFIADPIFVSNGLEIPNPGVLAKAARIVRDAGGMIIGDEVQSGFHRTGAKMWGFAAHEYTPDIVTLGKPIGNGFPMGAVILSSDVQDIIAKGPRYFNTFAGNPVAAAAGMAVLDVLEADDLASHVEAMGEVLRRGLQALGLTARGRGLAWSVDLGSPAAATEKIAALFEDGILAGTAGPAQDRLRIRPPLVFAQEHAERLFASLEST